MNCRRSMRVLYTLAPYCAPRDEEEQERASMERVKEARDKTRSDQPDRAAE